jgi:hypothetical protein
MSPVWLIEGSTEAQSDSSEAVAGGTAGSPRFPSSADQRLSALAEAVRDHESRSRHTAVPARPQDLALYRRLRQICGDR